MLLHKNNHLHLLLAVILAALLALLLLLMWATPVYAQGPTIYNWRGEYYNNLNLSGTPVLVRDDERIDFVWAWNAPATNVNAERFSVRWTRSPYFDPGTYRFTVISDDGVRLWVNNQLLVDAWYDHGPATFTQDIYLPGGAVPIKMDYYENIEYAVAQLSWWRVDNQDYGRTDDNHRDDEHNDDAEWRGEYYDNRELRGSPDYVRYDDEIDFDWGRGSPKPSRIDDDNFSVRWQRDKYFRAGRYRFEVNCDDGVRLYIDDKLVMNEWHDMPETRMTEDITLDSGVHDLRLEYYEHRGDAVVELDWDRLDSEERKGNIITCAPPQPYNNAWVKIYRRENGEWETLTEKGIGAIDATGFLKIDGLPVDVDRYGDRGHPYCIEVFQDGALINACGNTDRGETEFRVFADQDNYTPWQCAPPH